MRFDEGSDDRVPVQLDRSSVGDIRVGPEANVVPFYRTINSTTFMTSIRLKVADRNQPFLLSAVKTDIQRR